MYVESMYIYVYIYITYTRLSWFTGLYQRPCTTSFVHIHVCLDTYITYTRLSRFTGLSQRPCTTSFVHIHVCLYHPFPWGLVACAFTAVSFPLGPFCMRIYRGILSLGAFLHAHLQRSPFPWGFFACAFTAVSFPLGPFCMHHSAQLGFVNQQKTILNQLFLPCKRVDSFTSQNTENCFRLCTGKTRQNKCFIGL